MCKSIASIICRLSAVARLADVHRKTNAAGMRALIINTNLSFNVVMASTAAVVVITGSGSVASAQCNPQWIQSSSTGPSPREGARMVYDSLRDRVVLFGGENRLTGSKFAQTWIWDGAQWVLLNTAHSPPARSSFGMAYDSARDRIVLFGGGLVSGQIGGDTWEFDGTDWRQVLPTAAPSAREALNMAYDSFRQRTVLFGGGNQLPWPSDTWEWDGSTWNQRPVTGPGGRTNASMAFDTVRGRTIVFSGQRSFSVSDLWPDTWEWNGATWLQVATTGPSPRYAQRMSYDEGLNRVVLFGGSVSGSFSQETWQFNGATAEWARVATSGPQARYDQAMVFVPTTSQTLLFGGYRSGLEFGDTWSWTVVPVASHVSAQTTCPASNVTFSTIASGTGPFTYQWQWQPAGPGTAWAALGAGINLSSQGTPAFDVSGATTAALIVRSIWGLGGNFRCIVSNSCGSVTSNPATLTIVTACNLADIVSIGGGTAPGGGACPDGLLTGDDFNAFIAAFANGDMLADIVSIGGEPPPDGLITGDDFNTFIAAFANGCP